MADVYIVEKETGMIFGQVVSNHSLTFDEACGLAGLEWKQYPDVECSGWYFDNDILVDESCAELHSQ